MNVQVFGRRNMVKKNKIHLRNLEMNLVHKGTPFCQGNWEVRRMAKAKVKDVHAIRILMKIQ